MSPTEGGGFIVERLAAVMAEVRPVGKDSVNKEQHFNFRGIDAIVNAVSPAFRKHKVVVIPTVIERVASTVEVGQKRTLMGHVTVRVQYRFWTSDGSYVDAVTVGEAMDSGDKATAKAMSVAFRIALLQALALPTDEPDADSQTYQRSDALPAPTDKERNRLALLSELTTLADKAGVPGSEIEADWAASHDGQFIGDATDIGSLELLRDDLKARIPGERMTTAQKADHKALVADTLAMERPAERLQGLDPEDPWAQDDLPTASEAANS